ncbi:MAG: transposase [Hyphomicrobiaceae bacterium]|nr:transposase [Hyphomicrobiaceae bacterium]
MGAAQAALGNAPQARGLAHEARRRTGQVARGLAADRYRAGGKRSFFSFELNRKKLRQVRRREGRYLLRTNLQGQDPARLWQFYVQLVEIEAAFKTLKDDLGLRPIHHQLEHRIEAHIFAAFMAYCLNITLRARLKPLAGGLTPRAVLDKLATIQMVAS